MLAIIDIIVSISLFIVSTTLFYVLRTSTTRSSSQNWKSSDHETSRAEGLLYQDADGTATGQSAESVSNGLQIFLIAMGAVTGLCVSGFWGLEDLFKITQQDSIVNFTVVKLILVTSWALILVEVVLMIRARCTVRRFEIGVAVAISCCSIAISIAFVLIRLRASIQMQSKDFSFLTGQLFVSIKTVCISLSLTRRPEVYYKGRIVDSQYTTSMGKRYTFSWISRVLEVAQVANSIEMSDLPEMDNRTRAHTLLNNFKSTSKKLRDHEVSLWRLIYQDHRRVFIREWSFAFFESFAMIIPQVCVYKILTILELGTHSSKGANEVWIWICALGMFKLLHLFLETWLEWIKFGLLATPVRSQLTALIFEKSMSMKDVKTVGQDQVKTKSLVEAKLDLDEDDKYLCSDSDKGDEENISLLEIQAKPKEHQAPSKPSTSNLNLIGVDVQRVSMFCGENALLLGSAVKLVLGVWFLVYLIGWISTLAGLAVPLVMQPISIFVSKNYGNSQLAVMAARDDKTHIITEVLHGIRQIKFSALEDKWQALIMESRATELKAQSRVYSWTILLLMTWLSMPILLGAVGLSLYVWISKTMLASVAFTALSVFSTLEFTLSAVPINIAKLLDARISCIRIQQHLALPDKEISRGTDESVSFYSAKLQWPCYNKNEAGFSLSGVSLRFPPQKLSLIHGETGVGKSLILASIIGEADIVEGHVESPKLPSSIDTRFYPVTAENWIIPTSIAYVAQIPWIENGTIKSNILFTLPFDPVRYAAVLYASALSPDLKILCDGDATEVGALGVNLSGGQRQRVTFARALYSRAGILVLDDIFNAVDVHVGRHMLEYGLKGAMGMGRSIIIATHHVDLVLPLASYVVEFESGTAWGRTHQPTDTIDLITSDDDSHSRGWSGIGNTEEFHDMPLEDQKDSSIPKPYTEDETREQGRVKWKVYDSYVTVAGGWAYWAFALFVFILSTFLLFGRSYWIKIWSDASATSPGTTLSTTLQDASVSRKNAASDHLVFYLLVYLGVSLLSVIFIAAKIATILIASLSASKTLFETFTARILRTQLRWLDTVPTGRILNRFTSDFALIDSQLGMDFILFLNRLLGMATIAAAGLMLSSMMIFPVLLFGLACIYYTSMYMPAARALRRLESVNRSPVFDLFNSAISGLSTIRSFGKIEEYQTLMHACIDRHTGSSWYIILANRWVAFRQGIMGVLFALCLSASIVVLPNISVALAGFALSFGVEFSRLIIITISQYAAFELDMNSTERVLEYMTEAPLENLSGEEAADNWPPAGVIEFLDYETGYGNHLPPVLKGLNFKIESRQRIGVVGRTGSGKSTLTLALFRFLEARQGSILIDGVDTSRIHLRDLRRNLSIIPQDPVLFSGTLRSNLDPFNEHSDQALRAAISRVHLGQTEDSSSGARSSMLPEGAAVRFLEFFDFKISRGGLNLSSGQRQLVCLARAVLNRSKIVVLDEATSAVDLATERLIQQSIKKNFNTSTLIVIAHRLSTLEDFDKILVMENGNVIEFDTPEVLLNRRGAYWRMISKSKSSHEAAAT